MAPPRQLGYRLNCRVQQYGWGKVGTASTVANFAATGNEEFHVDASQPYAELWMGTHPKAPSDITFTDGSSQPFPEWITENQWALSPKIAAKFDGKLPFLFKVLSINKALSIQAHPNKTRAEQLRASDPEHYADSNHKPEIAVALTPFDGMCGFRPAAELAKHLSTIPELKVAVGEAESDAFCEAVKSQMGDMEVKACLKACFAGLMNRDTAVIAEQLSALVMRIEQLFEPRRTPLQSLLLLLNKQFPGGDVGCFCIFFLNVVHLEVGEAMFLGPNEPHAYMFGDCVECMATSDNVVRAGLTPKFKDVDCLVDMLTYRMETADKQKFPCTTDGLRQIYKAPVPEFDVAMTKVPAHTSEVLPAVNGPSILIVTSGSGKAELVSGSDAETVTTGVVLFVPAGTGLPLTAGADGMTVHVAFAE